MSKSAPSTSAAQLRLSSSRAELANWPEPTQKWGQLIKLFMTRLCCKHIHTHTNKLGLTMVNVDVRPLWFVGFLSAHFTLSLLVCLCCPFVPLPSLSLCPCHVGFIFAMRRATEVRGQSMPGTCHTHTQLSKHVVCMCWIQSQLAMLILSFKEHVNT